MTAVAGRHATPPSVVPPGGGQGGLGKHGRPVLLQAWGLRVLEGRGAARPGEQAAQRPWVGRPLDQHGGCEACGCLGGEVWCLWCNTNQACLDYPVTRVLPPSSLCQLSSARWGVCWVNFEALIITLSVLGGSVLLGVAICCCCCCCPRKRSRRPDRSEEKAEREREERRVRQEERRAEMKSRHDEIRRKYGLFKEDNPYARFENN
uniref:Pituitary tumor-transforming gene 1 protein-interacting protein n=1 Tax=Sus scrofa TaxID=9823 RepID=A0A8D1KGE0_PIG